MANAASERVLKQIDKDRQRIIEFEQALIRIPSETGNEKACQEFLADWLAHAGYQVDVFTPDEVPGMQEFPYRPKGADYTERPNVVVAHKGSGGGRSLLLMAHVDTVPIGPPEHWTYGPCEAVIADGKIYGRGAGDDKAGITAQVMGLECIRRAGFRLKGDVILCSVVDEEGGGGMGTQACMARGYRADAGIYCDGLNMAVHPANLGNVRSYIRFSSGTKQMGLDDTKACVDALYDGLMALRDERRPAFEEHHLYAGSMWPGCNVYCTYLSIGYDMGVAFGDGTIKVYAFLLPGTMPDEFHRVVESRVRQTWDGLNVAAPAPTVEWVGRQLEPYEIALDEPIIAILRQAGEEATGKPMPIEGQPGSDLYILGNYSDGMPSVATGPGGFGVAEGSHQPNESISIDDRLLPFVKTIALTMLNWCGWEMEER